MPRPDIVAAHPEFPWLSADDAAGVERFLRERGWIDGGERVLSCGKAGEGNMNLTLRVRTPRRSVILKQSRPWVEKYDAIDAPWDRAVSEARFYERVRGIDAVAAQMPRLLASDAAARALLLEDLGEASDFTDLYRGGAITHDELRRLAAYLATLHRKTQGEPDERFANRALRELNHAHIYVIPLQEDNGLDLDRFEPGLKTAAAALRRDAAYARRVRHTGERYLRDGRHLLHGDYFPGSWLRTGGGVRIIDPEFSFMGEREFDLGVTVAHLALAGRSEEDARAFLGAYGEALDDHLLARVAGAEVMRRLIGVAQLPLTTPAGHRAELLERSRSAVMNDRWEDLWPA